MKALLQNAYTSSTLWLLGERAIRTVVNFLLSIWLIRFLGPEQFGTLSFAQSYVFLFSTFATLGLDSIIVRDLVKTPGQASEILGSAFALKLAASVGCLPFLLVLTTLTSASNEVQWMICVIALSLVLQSCNVADFHFQAKVEGRYIAWANATMLASSTVIKILLILGEANLFWFAAVFAFDAAVLAIMLVIFYIKQL